MARAAGFCPSLDVLGERFDLRVDADQNGVPGRQQGEQCVGKLGLPACPAAGLPPLPLHAQAMLRKEYSAAPLRGGALARVHQLIGVGG